MTLTLKDLAAFAAAERQIMALPEAPEHALVEAPEPLALPDTPVEDTDTDVCDEPTYIIIRRCDGAEKILCRNHGRAMMLDLLKAAITGETCEECDQPIFKCWIPRVLTDEEKAELR